MTVSSAGDAAVFLDKDGTLIPNVPYNVDPAHIRLMPGTGEGLRRMQQAGYKLVVISNQSGVARGYFPEEALQGVEERLCEMLREFGISLAGFYWCPHHPEGKVKRYAVACDCRKPAPGLILRAAGELGIDPRRSWMIGDTLHDIKAGRRAGCRTVLVGNGDDVEREMPPERAPDLRVGSLEEAAYALCKADGERVAG